MNAFAGIRPNFTRGVKTRPPSFFSWRLLFAVGVICFPVGVQPPQTPANFYPGVSQTNAVHRAPRSTCNPVAV